MTTLNGIDWKEAEASLWESGYARLGTVLSTDDCARLVDAYGRDELFRSRIDMARYRFGQGDYKYFAYPLPEVVQALRTQAYPPLAGIANRWMEALGLEQRYPAMLDCFLEQCHSRGQTKATPLLLHYEAGGYNCLHQDLYGDLAFPFQIVCMLSQHGRDYTGGEFLLMEQVPRAQSRGEAISIGQGQAVVFTTRYRPVKGTRGFYRANLKHGVSRVRSGARYTLGVIFHDAR